MLHQQHIAELGPVFKENGIRHIILCPGSRNAPLTQLFTSNPAFHCYSIVDERSAGYIALGMARHLNETVAVVTTSGTAVLNLGPSVAEASYQHIPLLVLTADRPPELITQFNNQVIDQNSVFGNNAKGFYEFPLEVEGEKELIRELSQAEIMIRAAATFPAGPVHLNIPLTEPLYDKLPDPSGLYTPFDLPDNQVDHLQKMTGINPDLKILLMAGQGVPDPELQSLLDVLIEKFQAVVIAENIANLPSGNFINNPELLLSGASELEVQDLVPDLVISLGGQVVSKRLKLFLQSVKEIEVRVIEGNALLQLSGILEHKGSESRPNQYLAKWQGIDTRTRASAGQFLSTAPYCNLTAIHRILGALPANSVVHLGNSSTVRYAQMMPSRIDLCFFANRGTSGIDGSVSSAVGAAMVSEDAHFLILGDLSFVYDSNALWNSQYPDNLKIIVLNDGGGGIFRLLQGPDRMEFLETFSVTHHPVSLELLSQSFGRGYQRAHNMEELANRLERLGSSGSGVSVLEVDTTQSENSRIFKDFLNNNH